MFIAFKETHMPNRKTHIIQDGFSSSDSRYSALTSPLAENPQPPNPAPNAPFVAAILGNRCSGTKALTGEKVSALLVGA